MFTFDGISEIDLTVIVGIINVHDFNSDFFNIITVPFTFTPLFWFWAWTVDESVFFWTVGISPSVFTFNNTGVGFTVFN